MGLVWKETYDVWKVYWWDNVMKIIVFANWMRILCKVGIGMLPKYVKNWICKCKRNDLLKFMSLVCLVVNLHPFEGFGTQMQVNN